VKNALVHTWRLAPSSIDGSWLTVSYAATSVVLAMPLPQGAAELRTTYDTAITVAGLPRIIRVGYR